MEIRQSMILMRPANELEYQLYQELTQPLADWAKAHPGERPDPATRRRFKTIMDKIEHVGLRPSPLGLLVIDRPDILEGEHPIETVDLVTRMWIEAWLQTTGQMRRRHAYFQ